MLLDSPIVTGSIVVSGSTIFGSSLDTQHQFTGSLTVTGSLSLNGSNVVLSNQTSSISVLSASYAANSDLLDGRDSLTYANTGSNAFVGQQNINGSVAITGSLTTTGIITAQSINVQQVTSSIVYSSGSNIFGNSVSNTQSMTGSVGITGSLSVDGAATFSSTVSATQGLFSIANNVGVQVRSGNTSNYTYIGLGRNSEEATIGIPAATDQFMTGAAAGDITINNTSGKICLGTAAVTRLAITSGGNVGIGTTSISNPISFIRVLNISGGDAGIIFSNTNGTAKNWSIGAIDSGSFVFFDGTSERMRITSGGNVGIGTASPSKKLEVAGDILMTGTDGFGINLGGNAGSLFISRGGAFTNNVQFGGTTSNIDIGAGGGFQISLGKNECYFSGFPDTANIGQAISLQERMRITSAGNVGIGTTSPNTKLDVFLANATYAHFGNQSTTNTNYSGISLGYREAAGYAKAAIVQEQIGDAAARGNLHFLVDIVADSNSALLSDSKMMIAATTGRVGINSTNPLTTLEVGGTIGASISTLTYFYHGRKAFVGGPTSAFSINLATEFPQMGLTTGNAWAVFGKCCFLAASGGGAEAREFILARNTSGGWASANYGPTSNTAASLQSVTGSGTTITINMNEGSYVTVEILVMIR